MGLTYTPNLGLAMQEDKSDYLDWDALTNNWRIIDAASKRWGGASAGISSTLIKGAKGEAGIPEIVGEGS